MRNTVRPLNKGGYSLPERNSTESHEKKRLSVSLFVVFFEFVIHYSKLKASLLE